MRVCVCQSHAFDDASLQRAHGLEAIFAGVCVYAYMCLCVCERQQERDIGERVCVYVRV